MTDHNAHLRRLLPHGGPIDDSAVDYIADSADRIRREFDYAEQWAQQCEDAKDPDGLIRLRKLAEIDGWTDAAHSRRNMAVLRFFDGHRFEAHQYDAYRESYTRAWTRKHKQMQAIKEAA